MEKKYPFAIAFVKNILHLVNKETVKILIRYIPVLINTINCSAHFLS